MSHFRVRTFVLETDEDVERFLVFMRAYYRPMREQGRTIQLHASEYKQSRSNAQNAFMWKALLEPIALQHRGPDGDRFVSAVWNEHCKEQFLPEVNAKGMSKWFTLPSGERRLAMSTSDLDVDEMKDYLDQVTDYAIHELGVQLPANPRDFDDVEHGARPSRGR